MTNTALPLQRGKYPPFLPRNFYEAPQYSAYRPTTAAMPPSSSPETTAPVVSSAKAVSKALRTKQTRPATRRVERERQARAHEIHGWLDNLHLLHENYIAKDNGSRTISCLYPCDDAVQTSAEQATVITVAKPVAKKRRDSQRR